MSEPTTTALAARIAGILQRDPAGQATDEDRAENLAQYNHAVDSLLRIYGSLANGSTSPVVVEAALGAVGVSLEAVDVDLNDTRVMIALLVGRLQELRALAGQPGLFGDLMRERILELTGGA